MTLFRELAPRFVAYLLIISCALLLYFRYPGQPLAPGARIKVPRAFTTYYMAWKKASSGTSPYRLSDPDSYRLSPGVLAWISPLPTKLGEAWLIFSSFSIFLFGLSLLVGSRYKTWNHVTALFLGLVLSWKGILETIESGQLELVILSTAVIAGSLMIRLPMVCGLLLGILPWFKLQWLVLIIPLLMVASSTTLHAPGKKARRGRMLITGYLFSWFIWGAAIPAFVFGSDRAIELTRGWIEVLRTQPVSLYFSDLNQSMWTLIVRWTGSSLPNAIALTLITLGFLLGRLLARTGRAASPGETLAWISPWMLLTQLMNPLSWRWGSIFTVGMPLSIHSDSSPWNWRKTLISGCVTALWLLQLNPTLQLFGIEHWSELNHYGAVTTFWILLLFMRLD